MTSEHSGRDRRLEDEPYVDALLAESGFPAGSADDGGLRDTLLRLRSLRGAEVPEPCAELAALMGGAGPALAEAILLEGRARRNARKRRAVFTSLTVAASLGIAGAAAGNETVRRHVEGTIDTIVRSFSPPAGAGPVCGRWGSWPRAGPMARGKPCNADAFRSAGDARRAFSSRESG